MWLEHPVYPSLCNVTYQFNYLYIIRSQKNIAKSSCVGGGGGGACVGHSWPADYVGIILDDSVNVKEIIL